jgi:hypothetical protein
LAFVQRFVSISLNGGEVHEDVFAGLALDESEALAGIKPLHGPLFFHGISFSVVELFVLLVQFAEPPAVTKKGRELCKLAAPLMNESKGFTRAANAAKD